MLSVTLNEQHVHASPFVFPPVVRTTEFYKTMKTPVQTITGINGPRCIAFNGIGDMFVTSGDHCVHVYDSSGRRKDTIGKRGTGDLEFNFPEGIAISENTVYVADSFNHRVQSFTTSGKFLGKFGCFGFGAGHFHTPRFMSIDSDDRIYISDTGSECIHVLHSDKGFIASFDGKFPGKASFKHPLGLAIAPNGNLFIAGFYSKNVTILTREGEFVRSFEVNMPTGVAVDAAGSSFVTTDANPGPVSIFDSTCSLIHKIEGFHFPSDVKISPDGSVWISEWGGNKVSKYSYTLY